MMPLPLCTRATMVLFIVLTSPVLVAAMAATPATKGGVLVMGATGYIGKAVVQQLVSWSASDSLCSAEATGRPSTSIGRA